jgi:Ca2+-binding RTX toxin-like protein
MELPIDRINRRVFYIGAALIAGWMIGLFAGSSGVADAGTCDVEAPWYGTSGSDTKYDDTDGEDEENQWFALGGQDFFRSLACNDIDVKGGPENDDVGGGSGSDNVAGQDGRDDVYGGTGNDDLGGGDGDDEMFDEQTDDFDSADGNQDEDLIDFRDGDDQDSADGGPQQDTCRTNTGDFESNCELG